MGTVVQPGGGAQGSLGVIGVVFKLWGRDTGGALSMVEHPFPVGAMVPPHLHTRAVRPAGLAARADRQVSPHPAAGRLARVAGTGC